VVFPTSRIRSPQIRKGPCRQRLLILFAPAGCAGSPVAGTQLPSRCRRRRRAGRRNFPIRRVRGSPIPAAAPETLCVLVQDPLLLGSLNCAGPHLSNSRDCVPSCEALLDPVGCGHGSRPTRATFAVHKNPGTRRSSVEQLVELLDLLYRGRTKVFNRDHVTRPPCQGVDVISRRLPAVV